MSDPQEQTKIIESVNRIQDMPIPIQNTILDIYETQFKTKAGMPYFTPDYKLSETSSEIIDRVHAGIQNQYKTGLPLERFMGFDLSENFDLYEQYHGFVQDTAYRTHTALLKAHPEMSKLTEEMCQKVIYAYINEDIQAPIKNLDIPLVITLNTDSIIQGNPFLVTASNVLKSEKNLHTDNLLASYLLQKQGFDIKDIPELLDTTKETNDPFIKSLHEEILYRKVNTNQLAFLVSLPYKNIEKIINGSIDKNNTDDKYLHIPAEAISGLYNRDKGDGSRLEIKLKNDFSIPLKYIDKISGAKYAGYNLLKELYSDPRSYLPAKISSAPIIPRKSKDHAPSLSNVELFIKQFNDKFALDIKTGNSIILSPRSGSDYSIDSETGKPFKGTNQMLLQQIRKDNHYDNPNFTKLLGNETTSLKPGSKGHFISEYSDTDKIHNQILYVNHDTMNIHPHNLHPVPLELPPNTEKKSPENYLYNDIYNYLYSIYHGDNYEPSKQTVKNKNSLAQEISNGKISPIKCIEAAQADITEKLKNTQTRTQSKQLSTPPKHRSKI